jgi:hypothetical protein
MRKRSCTNRLGTSILLREGCREVYIVLGGMTAGKLPVILSPLNSWSEKIRHFLQKDEVSECKMN